VLLNFTGETLSWYLENAFMSIVARDSNIAQLAERQA